MEELMRGTKEKVKVELERATAWLSTTTLVTLLGGTRSSVGRALRYLYAENLVHKKVIPGSKRVTMQWILSKYAGRHYPDATPVWTMKAVVPATILSTNFTNPTGDLQMQIEQGVDTVVTEWVTAEKKFSAHDVTEELRKRVNDGSIQLDPGLAGTAYVGGKDVTKVEHKFIKEAVSKLMGSNRFPDYVREHNPAGFYEYLPIAQSAGSAPAAVDPAGTPPAASGSSYDGSSTL
jgi:hypothetical protein